jgi:ATP-dependent exoDNAse (exonuclease V) beta subunit
MASRGSHSPAPLADSEARARALDVHASWIVEAPAGSGKTGLLMQRFLKLLAEEHTAEPEEVLAITFTRKATAELRKRVLDELRDAASGVTPSNAFAHSSRSLAQGVLARDAACGWNLLARPERLRISTIDSLSAEIAETLPLLSNAGGGLRPVDKADALHREAARRTLLELGGADARLHDALRLVLLHRDGNLGDVERLLARMLAQREQWGELVPLGQQLSLEALEREVRPRLERTLETVVCEGLTRAARVMPADMLRELTVIASHLGQREGYKGSASPLAICARNTQPPAEHAAHLDHWSALLHLLLTKEGGWRAQNGISGKNLGIDCDKQDLAELKRLVASVREDETLREALCAVRSLPPARYPDAQWRVAAALFLLLQHAMAELQLLFAERGACDFTELAIAARTALAADDGAGELARAAGSALKHLLVDEMQDTSAGQYKLIELLTRSWDGHSQTLFLVGDPKQSIYLFRQARVERFLRTLREERIGDVPLSALRLTANFRSQATLVDRGFNVDFEAIFPSLLDPVNDSPQALDVPFVRADAALPASTHAAGRVWQLQVQPDLSHLDKAEKAEHKNKWQRRLAVEEAQAIRAIVESWRAKQPDASIAVLARAREHLTAIIAEFRKPDAAGRTIAYTALDIEKLGEQPEVLDLIALTRALLHPADRVAWLAVLHAPWCGLGLADLLAISGGGEPQNARRSLPALVAERSPLLSPAGQPLLARAWPVLEAALHNRAHTSVATHVERTWLSLGGDAALTPERRANAELFFAALREVEEDGGQAGLAAVDLAALDERVGKLYARPSRADGAVELMTMHGAKGLEWDVVLLPSLGRRGLFPSAELLNWLELDAHSNTPRSQMPSSSIDDAHIDAHIMLAPIRATGDAKDDKLLSWMRTIRRQREANEHKRVFYVACTRAKQELHLFGAVQRGSSGLCAEAASLLQAAWPAAAPFAQQAEADAAARETSPLHMQLRRSVPGDQGPADQGPGEESSLALAAAADVVPFPERPPTKQPPQLHRLPLSFDPGARFAAARANPLAYTPAAQLDRHIPLTRPEGSYAVRAFGNVVHRYLDALAQRFADGAQAAALLAEVAEWTPRLHASLRAEGLAPGGLERLAARALTALQQTLQDPVGAWLLAPHPGAASEYAVQLASQSLRMDRSFRAGAEPSDTPQTPTHIWIVDFKTTEPGALAPAHFEAAEKAKYAAQLERYATTLRALDPAALPIMLGLYYPLAQRLLWWPATN